MFAIFDLSGRDCEATPPVLDVVVNDGEDDITYLNDFLSVPIALIAYSPLSGVLVFVGSFSSTSPLIRTLSPTWKSNWFSVYTVTSLLTQLGFGLESILAIFTPALLFVAYWSILSAVKATISKKYPLFVYLFNPSPSPPDPP